jgi:hypothetical protein
MRTRAHRIKVNIKVHRIRGNIRDRRIRVHRIKIIQTVTMIRPMLAQDTPALLRHVPMGTILIIPMPARRTGSMARVGSLVESSSVPDLGITGAGVILDTGVTRDTGDVRVGGTQGGVTGAATLEDTRVAMPTEPMAAVTRAGDITVALSGEAGAFTETRVVFAGAADSTVEADTAADTGN